MNNRLAWSALLSAFTAAVIAADAVLRADAMDTWFFCIPDGDHGLSSLPAFLVGLLIGLLVAFPLCLLWLRWARPLEGCDAR